MRLSITERSNVEFNYSEENNNDVIRMFKQFLDSGNAVLTESGGIELQVFDMHDTPWYFVRPDVERGCTLWQNIIFPAFNKQLVPIRCHSCWKVVVRPRTLRELFQLAKFQEKCEFHCKCGIERRSYVSANYGGYFYFNSMQEGLDALDLIREQVAKKISPGVSVNLKRGCTEFEQAIPNSNNWAIREDQAEVEKRILSEVSLSKTYDGQSSSQVLNVKRRWVEFACEHGDLTYMEFNGGKPLYPIPVFYERQSD